MLGDKQRGARLQTCRVAIRGDMSLLAVFAGISSKPVSSRVSPPVTDKNKQYPTKNSHFVTGYDTGPTGALNANR